MEKITRKKFTEVLTGNASIFMGSFFRWNDEKSVRAMEKVEAISADAERRTVTENHSNYILFNNGSRLSFDQNGKKEYFSHTNGNGIRFVFQKTTYHDDFDGVDYSDYIFYVTIEAQAEAERTFRGVEILDEAEKVNLCRWLKANGYYYEASGEFEVHHLEIKCSEKEAEIINGKLEAYRTPKEKPKVQRRYNVEKLSFPIDGYEYDVQVFLSADGGKTFRHCGIGELCNTEQECQDYIAKYKAEHSEN